jgi:tetratricopeptide (TPR) repeat protein
MRCLAIALLLHCFVFSGTVIAQTTAAETQTETETDLPRFGDRVENSPFVEYYMLEELKQLRTDMADQKHELIQQIVDRELSSVDRGVEYATDTISYFFYLIAAASSVLVLVGWTSIRDIKERVHSVADQEISKLIDTYEERLRGIESQLNLKTELIEENREEIALTQEVHSLWLRAGQEANPANKIAIYDQILKVQPQDIEALTYKADAVLELDEPQWANNLCNQALAIDPQNAHAFYQLACAHTALNQFDQAIAYLHKALEQTEAYRDELATDPALEPLKEHELFKELLKGQYGA